MTRIEAPPGRYTPGETAALAYACTLLQAVQRRPARIATMSADEFDTWRASMRLHRDAWHDWQTRAVNDAAGDEVRAQGIAAGWWTDTPVPATGTVPLIEPNEAACHVIEQLGPDDARDWAWQLARTVRVKTARNRP